LSEKLNGTVVPGVFGRKELCDDDEISYRLAQTRLRLIEPDQLEEVTPALEPAIG
jgi:hypothetical protein